MYMCISHEENIVFVFTIKINFFMILRSIAILLMSPLNIIQQRYIYWNDLTVCIVSLYNLLLCILLLYNHCNDFAPCGTLIGIKISLSSCMSRQPVTLIPLLGTCHSDTMPWAWHRLTGQSVISLTLGFRKKFLSVSTC